MEEEDLVKFYKHARDKLDFLSEIDYSELSRAQQLLKGLDTDIPEEFHDRIRETVVSRLKDFYHIAMEHLKDYKPSDLRLIDDLAVKGNSGILQEYGIKRKKDAKGHPKPYLEAMEQKEQYGAMLDAA